MWLSLFLLAVILAFAYLQTIQGFFSALIMCGLTIICCALAFAVHESLAAALLVKWKPDFALPLSLLLSFAVPLVVLRLVADSLVRRSCLIHAMFDKIGGAACGLVTALLIVGVLAVGVQMLPFGEPFLGHRRVDLEAIDVDRQEPEVEHAIWLSPDRFAVGFASLLSSGILSGQRLWMDDHPDYVQEVGWSQTVPRGVRCYAPPGSIRVVSARDEQYIFKKSRRPKGRDQFDYEPESPGSRRKFVAVRFVPSSDAADADGQHRYNPFQIRLVGEDDFGNVVQFHPVAVENDADVDARQYVKSVPGEREGQESVLSELLKPNDKGEIAVVFEIPEASNLRFLEYKMGARASVPKPEDWQLAPVAPKPAKTVATPRTPPKPIGGRTHGANVTDARFSDRLPQPMTGYTDVRGDVEVHGDRVLNGHLMGTMDKQTGGQTLTGFRVPEGMALLQISAQALRPGSILGNAKNFAVTNLMNYLVTDDRRKQYKICGQVAIASVGGDRVYEIQYYPEAVGSIGGLHKFQRINARRLKGSDYELYFLFLIDSRRKVMTFSTTGSRGGQDISGLNLVAP